MFSKALLAILATACTASAAKFKLKTKDAGFQVASQDEAVRLYGEYAKRSARALRSGGKGSGGGGPQFIYEQDDDDAVIEVVDGDILNFVSPDDDSVALCTDTMCFGHVDAVLTGFTKDGVDFLAVNLSAEGSGRDWEFLCPSALQTAAIAYQKCTCASGETGTCNFVLSSDPVEGSNIELDSSVTDPCFEGVQGVVLLSCTYISPLPTIPAALLNGGKMSRRRK